MSTIYSSLKLFQFSEHLNALKNQQSLAPIMAPIHIRIKPINACNHHCWFCAYRADNLTLGDSMRIADRIPAIKMQEIVEDLIALKVGAVTFSGGGEPLLYPTIAETISRLGQGGIKIGCLSNGALLTGKVADAIAEHGTWIRISMDGWDDASYAQSRGVKDLEFSKIFNNIEKFIQRQSQCDLGISFIVTTNNASHIYEFCKKAQAIGVRSIKISGCVVANDGIKNSEYHEKIFSQVREQISAAQQLSNSSFSIVDHYHEQMKSFNKPYQSCRFASLLTVIGADCNVYSCQDKAYTDSGLLGSIKNQSFSKFWFSEAAETARRNINPQHHCQHHCVAHSKNLLLNEFLDLDPDHGVFV